MAAKWWVKKHGRPFPKEEGYVADVKKKDLTELKNIMLDGTFWDSNFDKGSIWGQLNDPEHSFDAVEEVLAKIEAPADYVRVRQNDPSKYKRFRIVDLGKGIKAVIGFPKDGKGSEVQSYLFKKKKENGEAWWTVKEAVKWVKEHKGKASADAIDWSSQEEISEAFEHLLEYELVCQAKIINIDDISTEQLAAAGLSKIDKDLMPVEFKLVHANTNKNKDTFLKEELKKASDTPKYKPIDWQHTDKIIGVMLDSSYNEGSTDKGTGKIVEDDYLKVVGVIYKYKFPAYAAEVIKRHENNNLFFSMEVWFDQAECSVCQAVFEKKADYCDHLKARGLPESTTNRVLKGLTFGGTGVVENPADKDANSISIGEENFDNIKEDNIMPKKTDGQVVFDTEKEFEDFVKERANELVKAQKDEQGVTQLRADLTKSQDEVNELKTKLTAKDTEITAAKNETVVVQTAFDVYKSGIEKEKTFQERLGILADAKIKLPEKPEVKDKVMASIKEMTNEAFNDYLEILKASQGKVEPVVPGTPAAAGAQVDVPNPSIDTDTVKFPALRAILDKAANKKEEKKD